tara:strand:+ start:266 stop:574 length:309 start_codon:yes stop_codon:yes gene_type:complete
MSSEQSKARFHAIVTGRVQGVCFRAYTRDYAREHRINGYVKNRSDGAVEVDAEGNRILLDQFIQWLHEGPPSARVEAVSVEWLSESENFSGFSVRFNGGGWW